MVAPVTRAILVRKIKMSNFTIKFSNPWFLLLLIPAIAMALVPYFRMNKRYRKTRNRITSIALHITVMVLAISVLSGVTIEYDTPNRDNEVILLVDTSDSGSKSANDKDDFVQSVIDNANSMFKLGVVKFGYDQVYAVELSNDTKDMYTTYLSSESPDNTATDISAALNYAASLFQKKETARIVLLSDALETDGKAMNTVKAITAQGIKVDTVSFPNEKVTDEVQIISMEVPNARIKLGEAFNVIVTLQSSYAGKATITPYDTTSTGQATGAEVEFELIKGIQTVSVPYTFLVPGLHNLSVELTSEGDGSALNNVYTSYLTIQSFDKILIIENIVNESESLRGMLSEELKVNVVNINDPINLPNSVKKLRAYDQIILVNVAYKNMPTGFDEMLYSYVHDFGGGLFTICGNEEDLNPNDEEWTPNAYTKDDMFGTTYQKLRPVEVIEYTPPAAVVIIIDRSGSMDEGTGDGNNKSKLDYAKEGAIACLDALTERDFVGIMSLGNDSVEELDLTPRPNKAKIISAIERIERGGNTNFFSALEHAGKILGAKTGVEKKHIIIVTDGQPTDSNDDYKNQVRENAEKGITMSIVGIGCYGDAQKNMIDLLKNYGGMTEANFHAVTDASKVPETMRADLEVPAIKDVNYVTFQPTLGTTHVITSNIDGENLPTLDGFYGVKAKEGAEVILWGEYTPIYAQWKCGLGTVGTFACDLNGVWSKDFINDSTGTSALLINNIIQAIFPTQNVQPDEIDTVLDGENFNTTISIFTDLEEGQYIELTITSPGKDGSDPTVQTLIGTATGYSRLTFAVKTPGLHEILVEKKDEDGSVVASTTTYKALGYSKEYDLFVDLDAADKMMTDLAFYGRGEVIEDPWDVFENAVKYIHNVINPKILFCIIALCLFLLDIAARKFKWKWPHEYFTKKNNKKTITRK